MGFQNLQDAITYVRNFLRDTPELNELLEGYETEDSLIAEAINNAIEVFNSTPPLILQVTLETFPNNVALRNFAVAQILKSAAIWYERNRLNYADGRGVTVVLKDKGPTFAQMASLYESQWNQWLTEYKMAANLNSAYLSTRSY